MSKLGREFRIYHDPGSEPWIPGIQAGLARELDLSSKLGGEIELPHQAYNPSRNQYDASKLLDHLIKIHFPALWVVSPDLYSPGMNFVFGYAIPRMGGVVSIHRLDSAELILKEAVHESGHILGLGHCTNLCVMQFSNSLMHAKLKPPSLCPSCRRKLGLS